MRDAEDLPLDENGRRGACPYDGKLLLATFLLRRRACRIIAEFVRQNSYPILQFRILRRHRVGAFLPCLGRSVGLLIQNFPIGYGRRNDCWRLCMAEIGKKE